MATQMGRAGAVIALALSVTWGAGCSATSSPSGTSETAAADDVPAEPIAEPEPPALPSAMPSVVSKRSTGIPHTGHLQGAVLSRSGRVAVTLDGDSTGRLWRTLDGTTQPQFIPVRNVRSMSVGDDGGTTLVALVDSGGVLHLVDGATLKARIVETKPLRAVQLIADNRVLAITREYEVVLLGADGKVLSRFERRRFRPVRVLLAADGKHGVLLEQTFANKQSETTLYRFKVAGDKVTVELGKDSISGEIASVPSTWSLSGDGKVIAYQARDKHKWVVHVRTLGAQDSVALGEKLSTTTGLAFVGRDLYVFGSRTPAMRFARNEDGTFDDGRELAIALAWRSNATQVTVSGNTLTALQRDWLQVIQLDTLDTLYLGYSGGTPLRYAMAPDGSSVAWVDGTSLLIEEANSGELIRIFDPNRNAHFIGYVDSDHLLVANTGGDARVIRLSDKVITAQHTVLPANSAVFAGNALLVFGRRNEKVLYKITKDRIGKPVILPRTTQLAAFFDNGEQLWVRISDGTDSKVQTHRVSDLLSGNMEPLAQYPYDANMRHLDAGSIMYSYKWEAGSYHVMRYLAGEKPKDGTKLGTVKSAAVIVTRSPDGTKLALAGGLSPVRVFDTKTFAELISFDSGHHPSTVQWSADSNKLLIGAQNGALIVQVSDGEALHKSCGGWFEVRRSEPQRMFRPGVPSICLQ